ncbi:hypothetical protein [Yoonia sp. SS1-5]|uniref:NolW-like domain-containing protein n=1 Tax=Yoonia rhodophyticola TaxID=3137370 RepID=A0AAN0NLM7_9RHOB
MKRPNYKLSTILGATLLHAITVMAGPATAESIDDCQAQAETEEHFGNYMVFNQRMSQFLDAMSQDMGLRIKRSDALNQRLSDLHVCGTIEKILMDLSRLYDIDWFSFNQVYFVSGRSEAVTRMIRLGDIRGARAIEALESSGVDMTRYPLALANRSTAIVVTAPPQFVAIVEGIVDDMKPEVVSVGPEEESKIIRIRRGTAVSEHLIP